MGWIGLYGCGYDWYQFCGECVVDGWQQLQCKCNCDSEIVDNVEQMVIDMCFVMQ